MKKVFSLAVFLGIIIQNACGAIIVKPQLGLGILLSPDLSPIKLPGETVTTIGANFNLQFILKVDVLSYGLELGYFNLINITGSAILADNAGNLGLRSYKEGVTVVPVLVIIQNNLKKIRNFSPYLQGGAGTFIDYYDFKTDDGKVSESTSKSYSGALLGAGGTIPIGTRILDVALKYYYIESSDLLDKPTTFINIAFSMKFK